MNRIQHPILVISRCGECEHCLSSWTADNTYCGHRDWDGNYVDKESIPSWCPLHTVEQAISELQKAGE